MTTFALTTMEGFKCCRTFDVGLIRPGDRKSVQPMVTRASGVSYDQLHHFVAAGVWDSAPLEAALLKKANDLVGDKAGFLVVDDMALPNAFWVGHRDNILRSALRRRG